MITFFCRLGGLFALSRSSVKPFLVHGDGVKYQYAMTSRSSFPHCDRIYDILYPEWKNNHTNYYMCGCDPPRHQMYENKENDKREIELKVNGDLNSQLSKFLPSDKTQ